MTFGTLQVSVVIPNANAETQRLSIVYAILDVYGMGHSERIISQVLKDRRKDIFLATKFGIDREAGVGKVNGTPEYLTKACDESLKRLGTDYIDLYYLHRVDKNT